MWQIEEHWRSVGSTLAAVAAAFIIGLVTLAFTVPQLSIADNLWYWPTLGLLGVIEAFALYVSVFAPTFGWWLPHVAGNKPAGSPISQPTTIGTIHATVASVQQTGGITAHTVSIGAQPRTFRNRDLGDLSQYLRQFAGTVVAVTCPLGDGEAASFAEEVKALLQDAGWQVNGVNHALRVPPPEPGVGLGFAGSHSDAPPWVVGFGERLVALGFTAYGNAYGNSVVNLPHPEIFISRA